MDGAAQHYLETALTIIETHALYRAQLDWAVTRDLAFRRAMQAQTPADTYATIRWVLTQLGDQHSFFAEPATGSAAIDRGTYAAEAQMPHGLLRPDRIALLVVPAFRGAPHHCTQYATTLQQTIAQLDAQQPLGWMLDLTDNSGGNMWPMLAGLGPLLGEGVLGGFAIPGQPQAQWWYRTGQAGLDATTFVQTSTGGYRVAPPHRPIALLSSARTASSGEAVILAFAGCPTTRRIGTATRGLTTANEAFPLADDATLLLTIGTFVDRRGRVYGGPIEPETLVEGDRATLYAAAAAWMLREEHERPGNGR
jgi:carboxyl-terminal processing protease